ncbi:MAG TPA: Fe-Mn family superoxide dismutase, partial [Terriglobia bacterium]|nr:Fe-Mn family superoxide dismutase [Terriglobia bacterium]
MISAFEYTAKQFDLSRLKGISEETLDMHFKLYEGYVRQTNVLNEHISDILGKGRVDKEKFPEYSELTRRLGFEYNGMVLHEYYFDNLQKGGGNGAPVKGSVFHKTAEACFGAYEIWRADFTSVGNMRGIGWAICYLDPSSMSLSNHWIDLHEAGNVSGFLPILVMDVWE